MSLERFQRAPAENLTVEDAVRLMIEGDNRIKLPACYELIGFPFFDRIKECVRILERRFDSAIEYETEEGQQSIIRQLENIEHIRKNTELYRNDLIVLTGELPDGISTFAYPDIVKWAREVHGVDIYGYHARQQQTGDDAQHDGASDLPIPQAPSFTKEEAKAIVERNTVSGKTLWSMMIRNNSVPAAYTEGQKVFLSISLLIDALFTKQHQDWRHIVNDETDKTSKGFLLNGRPNTSEFIRKIKPEFPVKLDGSSNEKTTKGHINLAIEYLTDSPDHLTDFSKKQLPMAYRTLYGAARATWSAMFPKKTAPDADGCKYHRDTLADLEESLPKYTELPLDHLGDCLNAAKQEVSQQHEKDIASRQ